ncbi:hypothetical protein N7494_008154 [Penicillium frequentans]|uniref:Uncharacterized protein n=1 Tax=Penicillium frequentans TaxID=3151616 RepID=A0AAD6GE50_9EURO|nr:hypothetical protein N7494_008154 [Penicillium glabrum]
MNAYITDYDENHFRDATKFIPERYLKKGEGSGIPHYGDGAGSKLCAGSHLAHRELFTAFTVLTTAFEMKPSKQLSPRPVLN